VECTRLLVIQLLKLLIAIVTQRVVFLVFGMEITCHDDVSVRSAGCYWRSKLPHRPPHY
jgi:hypothetical protein